MDLLTAEIKGENLKYKEIQIIQKVLEHYNFDILHIEKIRSVYKLETSTGNICLKQMKHGGDKCKNGYILSEELIKNGYHHVVKYLKTKDSKIYVKYKKYYFYATEWINGRECNMDDINEAVKCSKLLADFHIAASETCKNSLKLKNNIKNWPQIFNDNLNEIISFRKKISTKKIRDEFDILYLSYIDDFYQRGVLALDYLKQSNYYYVAKNTDTDKAICHNSFYYQNIMEAGGEYFIIDLDSLIIDLQVNDLGKFIRRLMYKKDYQWDFEKARIIIEAYSSVNNLTKEDLEIMLAIIMFPHKFWKLGKKKYIKNKNWSTQKYIHKLKRLIKYFDNQQIFFKEYIEFTNNYVNPMTKQLE